MLLLGFDAVVIVNVFGEIVQTIRGVPPPGIFQRPLAKGETAATLLSKAPMVNSANLFANLPGVSMEGGAANS